MPKKPLLGLLLSSLLATALHSEEERQSTDHLMVGLGLFEIVRPHHMWQLSFEYRMDFDWYNVRPLAGAMFTDQGSVYLCGGAAYDIFLGKHIVITPSFAPGVYFKNGGKDLHFPLEFRSSIELSFVLPNNGRLGAQFYHISNASLAHKNPGEESLLFFYAIPFPRK